MLRLLLTHNLNNKWNEARKTLSDNNSNNRRRGPGGTPGIGLERQETSALILYYCLNLPRLGKNLTKMPATAF
jgi:hypothetical protein